MMLEIKSGRKECPNCAGVLEQQGNTSIWKCPYCDSVFQTEKAEPEPNVPPKTATEKKPLLLCKVSPNGMYKDAAKTLYILGDYVGMGLSVQDYIQKLTQSTAANRFAETYENQGELSKTVLQKIGFPKYQGEKFLVYKSDGFLAKDKSGLIITDKSLYFLQSKSYYPLKLEKIATFSTCSYVNQWRINSDKNRTFSSINAGTNNEMALYLGLITELARLNHGEGYRLVIDTIID